MAEEKDPGTNFYENPDYQLRVDDWRKYRVLYEGDRSQLVTGQYLFYHELEKSTALINVAQEGNTTSIANTGETVGQRLRALRVERSRYLNKCEPVISNLISMAFSKGIDFNDVKEIFGEDGEEMENVDGEDTTFEDFITNDIAIAYFRDGRPIVQVNAPPAEYKNKVEEKDASFRPFMHVLDVLEVKDWQRFTSGPLIGKYKMLRHEYQLVDERSSLSEAPSICEYNRVWSFQEGKVIAKDGKETIVNVIVEELYKKVDGKWTVALPPTPLLGLTQIPIASTFKNESWLKEVSELQLSLFNLMSAWFNCLNTAAIQRVLISGDMSKDYQISISEYAWARIPQDAVPHVISPSDTTSQERAIAWCEDEILKVAFNRQTTLSATSKEAPGAETLNAMNGELLALLKRSLTQIEKIVNQAVKFYAEFKGIPDFKGKVKINKDLTLDDIQKGIDRYLTYKDDINKIPTWKKAHLKKMALEENFSEEELQSINKEIDAIKKEEEPNLLETVNKGTLNGDEEATKQGSEGSDDNIGG